MRCVRFVSPLSSRIVFFFWAITIRILTTEHAQNLKHYFNINVNPVHDHGHNYTLNGVPCCKDAFCVILGISQERFDRVYLDWTQEQAVQVLMKDRL